MEWLASQVQALVAAVDSLFQWLVGTADGRSTYAVTRWVFMRALGLIYLIAFVSFWVQVRGLIGSQGILPAQQYLHPLRIGDSNVECRRCGRTYEVEDEQHI